MTAATVTPTTDELIATTLARVVQVDNLLELPPSIARLHAIRQHLTVVRGNLGTLQRLRAKGVT